MLDDKATSYAYEMSKPVQKYSLIIATVYVNFVISQQVVGH